MAGTGVSGKLKASPGDALIVCTALLCAVQTPAQRGARAPAPPAKHDTIYVAVQAPPPTISVEAPSQWPVVAIGVATLLLLAVQLRIMARQTEILDRQAALAKQQADWRAVEAVGAFVKLAFDLEAEFRKANVLPGTILHADPKTHTRAVLREASRVFAPLGTQAVAALTQASFRVDEYFAAADSYNRDVRGREGAARLQVVQHLREQVGHDFNAANRAIPDDDRWRYDNGKDYDFRANYAFPPGLLDETTERASPGSDHTDVARS